LHLLKVFRRRKVTPAVRDVVLEPVGLLVTLIAIRLWASERFTGQKRRRGAGERRTRAGRGV
jgi:hypothetical protein